VRAHPLRSLHWLSITNWAVTARLLEKEPTNLQAQSLDTLIDKAVKRGMFTSFPMHPSLPPD
jgi:hypothetical protein